MAGDNKKTLNLKVAKAIPSDVGHGRARVPFDNDLNLKPGDIIEIKGDDTTAAIVWRCRPEDTLRDGRKDTLEDTSQDSRKTDLARPPVVGTWPLGQ